ncbi:MAG: phosphoglycerate kinase [Frankiaceae bacterium]|nr:phosphoglycerate kinase [Frankiaceae bacterium]
MQTLDDLLNEGVAGRRVLVRSDLNVPLDSSRSSGESPAPPRVADDGRIRASLPTIRALADAGARVVVMAHLGRPQGEIDPKYSLAPVAERMGELLGWPVPLAEAGEDGIAGASAMEKVSQMQDSDILLLENVRFEAAETSKDDDERGALADRLVALVSDGPPGVPGSGAYVDDAFGAVHRKHTSVYDIAERLPHYAGKLVLDEIEVLRRLAGGSSDGAAPPEKPYVVVLGGSKVSDKLAVIKALLPKIDRLLIGGGMCFTFLKAQNFEVGDSLLEADMVETCSQLLEEAGDKIVLPSDIVAATAFRADADHAIVAAEAIPNDRMGLDIGPQSVKVFAEALHGAKTVFWNGPMGVFELAPFAEGTRGVAEAIAALPGALSVVGGGDSAAAVRKLGIDEQRFGHISTGGGASLEYLEGKTLPGVAALEA